MPNITTHVYAQDGFCDDGGPGAEFDGCTYGMDCEDCGARYILAPPPPPVTPLMAGARIPAEFIVVVIFLLVVFVAWRCSKRQQMAIMLSRVKPLTVTTAEDTTVAEETPGKVVQVRPFSLSPIKSSPSPQGRRTRITSPRDEVNEAGKRSRMESPRKGRVGDESEDALAPTQSVVRTGEEQTIGSAAAGVSPRPKLPEVKTVLAGVMEQRLSALRNAADDSDDSDLEEDILHSPSTQMAKKTSPGAASSSLFVQNAVRPMSNMSTPRDPPSAAGDPPSAAAPCAAPPVSNVLASLGLDVMDEGAALPESPTPQWDF